MSEHEQDVCICGHVRFIHRRGCDGRYADENWVRDPNDPERCCDCSIFILKREYQRIDGDVCDCCGRPYYG